MFERFYEGLGDISLFGKSYKAHVILRPRYGDIVLRVPHDEGIDGFELLDILRKENFFGNKYSLRNLELITPIGKIFRDSLDVYPVLVNLGTYSIFDSFTLRIAHSSHAGIATFIFKPMEAFLVFNGQTQDGNECNDELYYELLFLGFRPSISPGLQVAFRENLLFLQSGKESGSNEWKNVPNYQGNFIVIRSSQNLFEPFVRDNLYKVLCLLNGSKVLLDSGFALIKIDNNQKYESKVAFDFSGSSCMMSNSIPTPFRAENSDKYSELIKVFIEKYLSYVDQLNEKDKRRFNLFVEYIIEGISVNANLESKLITLFSAVEIMDNATTLDKRQLANAYGLDINRAHFLIELRNKIVHNGFSVSEAINESLKILKDKTKENLDTSFLGDKKDLGCYFFLIRMLYKRLLTLIEAEPLRENLKI